MSASMDTGEKECKPFHIWLKLLSMSALLLWPVRYTGFREGLSEHSGSLLSYCIRAWVPEPPLEEKPKIATQMGNRMKGDERADQESSQRGFPASWPSSLAVGFHCVA